MPTIFTAYYPPARNLTKSNILNKRLAAYQYDDRSRSSREVTPSLAAARMRTTKASLAMRPLAALAGASALAYVLLALTTPAALLETPALRGAARNHSRLEVREMRKALEALRSGINELDAPAAPKPVAAASSPTCTFRAYVRAAAPRVLLREEYWQYGTPYPLNGTADFYDYENAGESFDYMMRSGMFDAPAACAR